MLPLPPPPKVVKLKPKRSRTMSNVNLKRGKRVSAFGRPRPLLIPGLDWFRLDAKIDPLLEQQFNAGRLYAAISSRPGQSGRADGYILEGKELEVSASSCLKPSHAYLAPCLFCSHWLRHIVLPQEAENQQIKTRLEDYACDVQREASYVRRGEMVDNK